MQFLTNIVTRISPSMFIRAAARVQLTQLIMAVAGVSDNGSSVNMAATTPVVD